MNAHLTIFQLCFSRTSYRSDHRLGHDTIFFCAKRKIVRLRMIFRLAQNDLASSA